MKPGAGDGWYRLAPVNGSEYPLWAGSDCEGDGWYLVAPVNGSPPRVVDGTEAFEVGRYRDAPVKGSPLMFWLGMLPPVGWYREAPLEC